MLPPLADRFVAGETAAEVLDHARRLNDRGVGAICNRLGEHYERAAPADADATAYVRLVEDIAASDLRACVSLKPSQLGLDVGEDRFRANLERVVGAAADGGVFVWLDMEDHTTTDATIDAFEGHVREHGGGVGVCLQANLRRTPEDIDRLADCPGKIRLVKGAYDPPEEIAFVEKRRIDAAYRDCLERLFADYAGTVAVGSHDPAMIERARRLHGEYGTDYEVQMLMGVREQAQCELAGECPVWQYVPYGDAWLSYLYRRVAERRQNAVFAARALLGV